MDEILGRLSSEKWVSFIEEKRYSGEKMW